MAKKARKAIPQSVRRAVLFEAGYSCANPTCHVPLLHAHHIDYVEEGGDNSEENLIALCPNCHTMVHNKVIPTEAVKTWKTMLVSANHVWTKETLNALLFLDTELCGNLYLTGDGVVRFCDLIVAGLAHAESIDWIGDTSCLVISTLSSPYPTPASEMTKLAYKVKLTRKGQVLVNAWKQGDLRKLQNALVDEEVCENDL